jgi:hypothetical protein
VAWEKRRSGRKYFYLSRRGLDGKVQKQYIGRGLGAALESVRLDLKRVKKQRQEATLKELFKLESMAADYSNAINVMFEAHLYAAGYHNPKGRGWRKQRSGKMTDLPVEEDCDGQIHDEPGCVPAEDATLEDLVHRCRQGDRDAAAALRRLLHDHPDLFSRGGHITAKVQAEWIRAISGSDLFEKEVMLRTTSAIRAGLLNEGTGSYLEQLMVDQVVSTHLEQGFHDLMRARSSGLNIAMSKDQQDTAQRAHRRYEKALADLATLRTILTKNNLKPEAIEEKAFVEKDVIPTLREAPAQRNRLEPFFGEKKSNTEVISG